LGFWGRKPLLDNFSALSKLLGFDLSSYDFINAPKRGIYISYKINEENNGYKNSLMILKMPRTFEAFSLIRQITLIKFYVLFGN
jgi:hypothetical protein